MFRKLSAALYHVTHQQIASTCKWSARQQNGGLKSLIENMKDSVTGSLFRYELPLHTNFAKKLTIVGSMRTGLAMAYSCLDRELCNQICIMDYFPGEEAKHQLLKSPYIKTTKSFPDTRNSDLIVVTKDLESKKYLSEGLDQMTNVMKSVIPSLVKYSPNSLLFIDTYENEVINEVARKLTQYPRCHILHPNHKLIQEYMKSSSGGDFNHAICSASSNPCPLSFCLTDVAATILENYQRIMGLTTLEPSDSSEMPTTSTLGIFDRKSTSPVVTSFLGNGKCSNMGSKFRKILV